jgi:hypothetical protein
LKGAADVSVHLSRDGAHLYQLEIRGILTDSELQSAQRQMVEGLEKDKDVRLLVVLDHFGGWDPHSEWRDLGFYARYGDRIARLAIVGDERWRSQALMFAGADLRRTQVAFFPPADLPQARSWVAAGTA